MLNRRPIVEEKSPQNHWDILKGSGGEKVCCICKKKLKESKAKFIGKHPETKEPLWRDDGCGPGSPNWKKLFNGYIDTNINKILKGEHYGRKS
jgi:hypothetical protein